MPKTVYFDGVPMQFADDVTDDEIVQFGDQQKQQGGVMSKVLSPMANMLRQATAYTAPVDVSTTPQIKGANYAFAGQQGVQNALAASQRSQQDRVSSQIQLRAMQAREMEAEKDRQQQFKLQQQQLKSQMTLADHEFKMDQELEKARAEGNYRKAQIIEQERQRGMTEREGLKNNRPFTLSPGSMRVDPATGETMVNPRAEATRAPKIETSVQEVDGKKIAYTWEDGVLKGAQELGAVTPKASTQSSAANLSIYKQATENVQNKLKAEGLVDELGVVIPEAAADVPLMVDREYRRLNEIVGAQPPAAPATGAAGIADHLRSMQNQGTRVLYDGKPGTRMPDGSIVLD
jgi:hypothetical protein